MKKLSPKKIRLAREIIKKMVRSTKMKKPTPIYPYKIIIEADNGCYHAFCPELKGLHVGGNTKDEAFKNVVDAMIAYIESLIKHGDIEIHQVCPICRTISKRKSK